MPDKLTNEQKIAKAQELHAIYYQSSDPVRIPSKKHGDKISLVCNFFDKDKRSVYSAHLSFLGEGAEQQYTKFRQEQLEKNFTDKTAIGTVDKKLQAYKDYVTGLNEGKVPDKRLNQFQVAKEDQDMVTGTVKTSLAFWNDKDKIRTNPKAMMFDSTKDFTVFKKFLEAEGFTEEAKGRKTTTRNRFKGE